ncbi:MAG: phosphoribosyltransferase family protein [Desulfobaccales bacterium]|nr:phosphoribosyltransferase family protein [Desulfobaccales bacterium]
MGTLVEDPGLRDRLYVFKDRTDAGRRLAARLLEYYGHEVHLFAIPAGGVPVGAEIARVLKVPLDLVIARKIQLPWTTEAGFGALDPAGQAVLNEELLRRVPLSPQEIEAQLQKTLAALRQREARLRGGRPYPDLAGRPTLIVDDGLASGYTMRAAIKFLRGRNPGEIIVAVPTASARTAAELLPLMDRLVCLNVRGGWSFAVADAYVNWYDLTEEEVLEILESLPKRNHEPK